MKRNFLTNQYLVCGRPYLTPTPTLGRALTTFFKVAWSGKANMMAAEINMMKHNAAIFCFLQKNIGLLWDLWPNSRHPRFIVIV